MSTSNQPPINYLCFKCKIVGDHWITKCTKKHQTHTLLKSESAKRQKEWSQNVSGFNLKSTITSVDCLYYRVCSFLLEKFVSSKKINRAMFEPNGNRCFCEFCCTSRGDDDTYSRGEPSQIYAIPSGYSRFGIKLPEEQQEYILDEWHVVYHGTKSKYLKEISESGLILLKANDFKLNKQYITGDTNQSIQMRSEHIQNKFKRINKHSNKVEIFDPFSLFTSPSCIYSSYYCDKIRIDGFSVSFMFQCRQKPGTYSIGQETMGFDDDDEIIDKYFENRSIEFYTKHNLDVLITGILVKIHNFDRVCGDRSQQFCWDCSGDGVYDEWECRDCDGSGHCRKCSGTGILDALECYKCDGSGQYGYSGECWSCEGSGIYRESCQCTRCLGSPSCSTCDGTGIYHSITCRTCDGKGFR